MDHATEHKKPLLFRSLTGLTVPEFDQISTEMDSI